MFIRVGIFRVVMCEHGPSKGPDDRDEAACAFYKDPENLVPTGPGRLRKRPFPAAVRYVLGLPVDADDDTVLAELALLRRSQWVTVEESEDDEYSW
jgi:hypothetical protein